MLVAGIQISRYLRNVVFAPPERVLTCGLRGRNVAGFDISTVFAGTFLDHDARSIGSAYTPLSSRRAPLKDYSGARNLRPTVPVGIYSS
jgi:hypothetical protein